MDFETISNMKVSELKDFLRLRGLKVSGKKCELVSRVFIALENDAPVLKTAEEIEGELSLEYQKKLVYGATKLPDPFKLVEGWKTEEEGIGMWPLVPTFYIIRFLMMNSAVDDLSDYKSSKAYSYFEKGWLGNILYNDLDGPFCFLKTDCRPSQKISDVFHKLWLLISKADGNVLRAHCTCMAGMGSTCNHVAAALFRVEAAMRLGLSNPACTTKPCQWLPNRTSVDPCKAKNINFNRDDFSKRGKQVKKINSTPKKEFNPLINSRTSVSGLSFEEMIKSFEESNIISETILSTAVPKPEIDFYREVMTKQSIEPESVLSLDDVITSSKTLVEFFENMRLNISGETVKKIEKITRGQSSNHLCFQHRKGVITASKVHEVKTKMGKVIKGCSGNQNQGSMMWSLIKNISGMIFINPNIPALKYGRDMEPIAANRLYKILKVKHRGAKMEEPGLYLDPSKPFVGASPDRIFSCKCHSKMCVEIKCPFSISHKSPKDDDIELAFLHKKENGEVGLKKSHNYYTQCQLQLGVTGLTKCVFFVYTAHGHILEEIDFDQEFYSDLSIKCDRFYREFYLPSIYK